MLFAAILLGVIAPFQVMGASPGSAPGVPTTGSGQGPVPLAFDIGPFARVVASDSARDEGTRAGRLKEFPAEDVFLTWEIGRNPDGTYTAPAFGDGRSCIGLEWAERRVLKAMSVEFASTSPVLEPAKAVVQYWSSGGREDSWAGIGQTPWQGKWEVLPGQIRAQGNRWTVNIDAAAVPEFAKNVGVFKIRWIFPAGQPRVVVRALSACTTSRWATGNFKIEIADNCPFTKIEIEAYNGIILDSSGRPVNGVLFVAPGVHPLHLTYAVPGATKADRTVLRFGQSEEGFAVSIEDVLSQDAVYVKDYGVLVARAESDATIAAKMRPREQTVLDQIHELPDQTFSQAMAVLWRPVQNNGPTMLSLACDNAKFIADREGGVRLVVGDKSAEIGVEFGTLQTRPDHRPTRKIERHLDGQWLPIPVTTIEDGQIRYRQRTYVAPWEACEPKTEALCAAEFSIENPGPEPVPADLRLGFQSNLEGKGPLSLVMVDQRVIVSQGTRVVAWVDFKDAPSLEPTISKNQLTLHGRPAPAGTSRCVAYIPGWAINTHAVPAETDSPSLRQATEAYWKRILRDAMQVDLPEPLLADMIRSTQVRCMIAARNQENGSLIEPYIAADRYGPLDTEAQAVILGMDLMGHHGFARRSHEFFIQSHNKAGFLAKKYTLMGTGQHLWTLAEHFALTRNTEWLGRFADELVKSCDWIGRQLEKTKRLDSKGNKVPEYGLMPPGVLADWDRYAYYTYANAHYCAGLEGMATVLASIDHPRAREIGRLAADYRQDILRAFRWNQARMPVVSLRDGTWVPPCPSSLYCFGLTRDYFGGVSATGHDVEVGGNHIIPLGLLDPHCRQADWIVNYMEDRWFLIDGIFNGYPAAENEKDWFNRGGFSKLQPHYTRTSDIHALRDDVKAFIRTYFNTFPVLLNRENLTYWEHLNNGGAWDKTHESAWFLQMTRTMLLTERGDELWLAPFVTGNWLKDGMKVEVRNTPTHFGQVNYSLKSSVGRGYIDVTIERPKRSLPKVIVVRVRHPDGKPIRSVRVNDRPHNEFDAVSETIKFAPGDLPLRARIFY